MMQVVIYPSQDAEIWQAQPDTNFNLDELWVASQIEGGNSSNWRTVLKFDVSQLDYHIVEARLILTVAEFKGSAAGRTYNAIGLNKDWAEGNVAWSHVFRDFVAEPRSSSVISNAATASWDVTDLVHIWMARTYIGLGMENYGLGIWDNEEDSPEPCGVKFYSREVAERELRPRLIVTVSNPQIAEGRFVSVDWGIYPNDPEVRDWAVLTGDAQYVFLAELQGISPAYRVRPFVILYPMRDARTDSTADKNHPATIWMGIDYLLRRNLPPTPPDPESPSYGMTREDYGLQRVDAAYYHELVHAMVLVADPSGDRPEWFYEGVATWAQSAVTDKGAYTGAKPGLEDSLVTAGAYRISQPNDVFTGTGVTAALFWWLVENYGVSGLRSMIRQCFGLDAPAWRGETDIDAKGFVPWTGMTKGEISMEYYAAVKSGWRAKIQQILSRIPQEPEFTTTESPISPQVTTPQASATYQTMMSSTVLWPSPADAYLFALALVALTVLIPVAYVIGTRRGKTLRRSN